MKFRQKKYHAECQSTTDGTLMIRLFEYDAQIAIEDAEQKRNEVIFTFPHTTLLYLRCSKNTPSRMRVTIKVPGDSAGYEIPIIKVPEYTLEEIMGYLDRKLKEGSLTALQRWVIQETTKKVADNLAVKHKKVQEGVAEIMGGQVLELECVKQWNAGMKEGREEGKISVLNDLVKDGVLTLSEAAKRVSMTEERYLEQVKEMGL